MFAVAACELGRLCSVAIIGRPRARALQDGWTAEIVRLCTDGTHNACSILYGAAWRAARALGYRRLVTYTLAEEPGRSLVASGWHIVERSSKGRKLAVGGSWSRRARPRSDNAPIGRKVRWEPGASSAASAA